MNLKQQNLILKNGDYERVEKTKYVKTYNQCLWCKRLWSNPIIRVTKVMV